MFCHRFASSASFRKLSGLAFAAAFLLTAPAPAAPPEPEPEDTFSERVDVRVINLEAVVEDAQGNRVEGLGSGDFEILVDGKSQPVEYFTEIRSRQMAPAAPSGAPADAGGPARPPGLDPSGRLSTSYVVFVDLATSMPGRAQVALDRLADDLGQLPPDDKIAVFVFDGVQLANLADWRDPREQTLRSLRSFDGLRSTSGLGMTELRASDRFFERRPDLASESRDIEDVARRWSRRLEATFGALSTTLRSAAPPPGRRVALAFAGSWPRDMAAFLNVPQNAADNMANRVRTFYPTRAYSGVYETANRLGYTLYTADLETGQRVAGNAENGSVELGQSALSRDLDRDFEGDATLMRYADQTGGQAFTGGWTDNTLATVQDDLSSFYWLGFSARTQDKDKGHKLEVRVKRPGLKVRSRKEYSDLSRKSEIDQELESRLLFARTRAKQDFTVAPGEPQKKRNEYLLPITFRIPLDLVVFRPKGRGYAAELELRVAALDERGQRSPTPNIPVTLEGPQPPQPGQYATYETQLRLRPESRRFVLGLYDKVGDRLLVSTVDLDER